MISYPAHVSRPCVSYIQSSWVPEAGDGLLDDGVVQALVEHVGEGGDGGPPGHGEQVVVVAPRGQREEETLGRGPPVEQHAPHIVLLHQARLLVWHHNLVRPGGGGRERRVNRETVPGGGPVQRFGSKQLVSEAEKNDACLCTCATTTNIQSKLEQLKEKALVLHQRVGKKNTTSECRAALGIRSKRLSNLRRAGVGFH